MFIHSEEVNVKHSKQLFEPRGGSLKSYFVKQIILPGNHSFFNYVSVCTYQGDKKKKIR